MSAPACRRCNRPLTNPASVLAGIGPTCAAKEGAQLRFQSAKPEGIVSAKYRIVGASTAFIWIEDIGTDCRSVTNDAEAVVAALVADYGDRRIIYKDSMGRWDELVHRGPVFTGYAPAGHLAHGAAS